MCMIRLIIFILYVFSFNAFALNPIDSVLLGKNKSENLELSDPINYQFTRVTPESSKKAISLYRGFYQEGQTLENKCELGKSVEYFKDYQKKMAKRSSVATLQYIGLDISTRAISEYAKYFEYSQDEYNNLVNNLVGNYCSANLTIISKKELKTLMLARFEKGSNYELPNIESGKVLPKNLVKRKSLDLVRKNEFYTTLNIFRSMCSWGNSEQDLRLMVPFLRNPIIMSYISRAMGGKELAWNEKLKKVYLATSKNDSKVVCENFVCRKYHPYSFNFQIPRAIGSEDISQDIERLYCNDFKYTDFRHPPSSKIVAKWIEELDFEQQNIMTSHLISLITGVPDIIFYADKYSDVQTLARSNLDEYWDNWANNKISLYKKNLLHENPLTLEKIDRSFYFKDSIPKFSVQFDLDMGEFDREIKGVGKLQFVKNVKLSKVYLAWLRREWRLLDPRNTLYRDNLITGLRKRISLYTDEAKKTMDLPFWNDAFADLIAKEVLSQVSLYYGRFFIKPKKDELITIPVRVNVSLFALKYFNYMYRIKRNQKNEEIESSLFAFKKK